MPQPRDYEHFLVLFALVLALFTQICASFSRFMRGVLISGAALFTIEPLNRIATALRQHRAAPLRPLFLRGLCPTPSLSDEDCPPPTGQIASPLLAGAPISRHRFLLSFKRQVVEQVPSITPSVPLEESSHTHTLAQLVFFLPVPNTPAEPTTACPPPSYR